MNEAKLIAPKEIQEIIQSQIGLINEILDFYFEIGDYINNLELDSKKISSVSRNKVLSKKGKRH